MTAVLPMADGGEGTVQSLVDATEGTLHQLEVNQGVHVYKKLKYTDDVTKDSITSS